MTTTVTTTEEENALPVLYCDKDLLVVQKPAGVSSQADPGRGSDLLTLAAQALRGRGEADTVYPVHRLDLAVGGLVVIARTSKAAAALSAAVAQKDGFVKGYYAVAEGIVTPSAATLTDHLRHDTLRGRAVLCRPGAGGKRAELSYRTLATGETTQRQPLTLLSVRLMTGRFHQIRAQLSGAGFPLVGDRKYGAHIPAAGPALFAGYLSFRHPGDGRQLTFSAVPPTVFPFSDFPESAYTPLFFEKK